MYLLFDAEDSKQNKFKDRALNFADGQGMANSDWRSCSAGSRLRPSDTRPGAAGSCWTAYRPSRPSGGPAGCA